MNTDDEVKGLPKYLYYGQDERVEELNDRIYTRDPKVPLEVNYTPRSVSTKYSRFPIVKGQSPNRQTQSVFVQGHKDRFGNLGSLRAETPKARSACVSRLWQSPNRQTQSVFTPSTIKPNYLPTHNVEKQFVTGRGPVSGYFANIDKENTLRNQYFALQRDIGQSTFIPSTNSDLYKNYIVSRPSDQPFPKLFENYKFDPSVHPNIANNPAVGSNLFFNDTRAQLRGNGL
jgi:hypothetical protein